MKSRTPQSVARSSHSWIFRPLGEISHSAIRSSQLALLDFRRPAKPSSKAEPGTCGGLSLASLAEIPSLACFKAVLAEPINDVHAVLGVTLVGLAALALY